MLKNIISEICKFLSSLTDNTIEKIVLRGIPHNMCMFLKYSPREGNGFSSRRESIILTRRKCYPREEKIFHL